MAWTLLAAVDTARKNAALTAVINAIDANASAGTVKVYTGTSPGPGSAPTGTLLATVTLIKPSFGSVSSASASLADPAAVTAVGTGTAGYCRVADGGGTTVMDGTVTATGGGGDLTLASTSIATGQTVDVTGGTLTQA